MLKEYAAAYRELVVLFHVCYALLHLTCNTGSSSLSLRGAVEVLLQRVCKGCLQSWEVVKDCEGFRAVTVAKARRNLCSLNIPKKNMWAIKVSMAEMLHSSCRERL